MLDLRQRLEKGLHQLGLELSEKQCDQLLDYVALLVKWNKVHNLTAIRDPAQMVDRHLMDSLAILPHLRGDHILDVGSGAGLPGIPLAIAAPEKTFTLLDSIAKKVSFLTQVKIELGLVNVSTHQGRVENFHLPEPADTIVTRAFASMADTMFLVRHLLQPETLVLCMKGPRVGEELKELCADFVTETLALEVPGLDKESYLVKLKAKS